MKRIALFVIALFALNLVSALPASAHGSCTGSATVNLMQSQNTVTGVGSMDCTAIHDDVDLTVLLWERLPGGSWQIRDAQSKTLHGVTHIQSSVFWGDCFTNAKYKTEMTGRVRMNGGLWHNEVSATSAIKTC